jgi:DNA-binding NarL/FixJ family response regulator
VPRNPGPPVAAIEAFVEPIQSDEDCPQPVSVNQLPRRLLNRRNHSLARQLPDITGIEATRRLKANEDTRAIPIITVTAFAMSGDREMILESGCDDYVPKPFNVLDFLRLVEAHTKRE